MAKLEAKELVAGVFTLSFYVPDKVKWGALVSKIKMLPDRIYVPPSGNKSFGHWECPVTPRNIELLEHLKFKITRMKVKEVVREKVTVNLPTSWKKVKLRNVSKLARPYQLEGIKQMVDWDCNLLQAFDMGLGKSLMSISAMNNLEKFPVLIICPATIKLNWQREIDLWSNKPRTSYIVEGTTVTADYSNYDYIIINYDILWHNLEFILDKVRPMACIFDECHVLKNGGSFVSKYYPNYKLKKNEHIIEVGGKRQIYTLPPKRVRATQWLVNGLPEELEEKLGKKWSGVKHTMLLTGTPIQNNNSDLFNLLQLLNPKQFVNKQNFVEYFCKTEEGFKAGSTKIVGSKNNDMLHKILSEKYMIRKLKDEVLTELPPLTKSVIPLPLEPSYRKDYDRVDEDFLEWINDFKSRGELSAEQERLERNSRFRTLLELARDGKLESCFQYIDNIVNNSKTKVIIFSYHRKVINVISERYGKKCVELHGGTSLVNKQKAVDDFQTDPEIQVFNTQMIAGSTGITLTASSTVIFVETGFMSHLVAQAIDRSRRFGNTSDNVHAIFLQAESTLEQMVLKKLDMKHANMESVVDGIETQEEDMLSYLYKEYTKKT